MKFFNSQLYLLILVTFISSIYCQVKPTVIDSLNTERSKHILVVNSDLDSSQVYLNKELIGKTKLIYEIVENKSYKLSVIPNNLNFESFDSTIVTNSLVDTINIQIYFNKAWLTINCNIDSSEIILESNFSKYSGRNSVLRMLEYTPLREKEISPAGYFIKIRRSGYYSQSFFEIIKPRSNNIIDISLEPLSKNKALFLSFLFPGLGQWYSEKTTKAILMNIIAVSSISTSIILDTKIATYKDKYKSLQDKYRNSLDEEMINATYKKMNNTYDDMEQMKNWRNVFIGLSTAVYIAGILDAYFYWPFENVYPTTSLNSTNDINVGIVYEF